MKFLAWFVPYTVALVAGCGYVGWAWAHARFEPVVVLQRVYDPPRSSAMLLPCPMSKRGIEEWERTCRARKRSELIKGESKP